MDQGVTNIWNDLEVACDLLSSDEIVGLPTETVYGLAASIDSKSGLRKIFETKARPFFDPLIVHVASKQDARTLVTHWPDEAECLASAFWPGPLTLILPKSLRISDVITAGLPKVGIRLPAHPVARRIAREIGAFAAPSANRFGKTSPSLASHVRSEFPDQNLFIVDGGPCRVGIESTIVEVQPNTLKILRAGMIQKTDIESQLLKCGISASVGYSQAPHAPGQLDEHYQPQVPLCFVSNPSPLEDSEILSKIGLGASTKIKHLQLSSNAFEAARELYSKLRSFQLESTDLIVFQMKVEMEDELWFGILDRLRRASSHHL